MCFVRNTTGTRHHFWWTVLHGAASQKQVVQAWRYDRGNIPLTLNRCAAWREVLLRSTRGEKTAQKPQAEKMESWSSTTAAHLPMPQPSFASSLFVQWHFSNKWIFGTTNLTETWAGASKLPWSASVTAPSDKPWKGHPQCDAEDIAPRLSMATASPVAAGVRLAGFCHAVSLGIPWSTSSSTSQHYRS